MKKQKVVTLAPEAEHSSVYVFHNKKYDTNLFINAWDWIIMLELENQPSKSK